MMRKVFINLDRSIDRLETFLRRNKHIDGLERFSAIDGQGINRQLLKEKGLLQEGIGVEYTDGALGCALSHKAQWECIISDGEGRTIIEDDVVFCKNFELEHQRLLSTLPETWDIVLWGYPLCDSLFYDLLPGRPYSIEYNPFNQKSLMRNVATWHERVISGNLHKLYGGYGTSCYSLSPWGAEKFLKFCFPIRPLPTKKRKKFWKKPVRKPFYYPALNLGLDCCTATLYPKVEAYVCVPPLVGQFNDLYRSTVRPKGRSFQAKLKVKLFQKFTEPEQECNW